MLRHEKLISWLGSRAAAVRAAASGANGAAATSLQQATAPAWLAWIAASAVA